MTLFVPLWLAITLAVIAYLVLGSLTAQALSFAFMDRFEPNPFVLLLVALFWPLIWIVILGLWLFGTLIGGF